MQDDEREIRQLVSTWMDASKSGDVEKVLSLMTDDVVFLVTGQPVMRKADFAAAVRAQAGADAPEFDGSSEIQEIKILDGWAFMWQKLTVSITPPDGAESTERAGGVSWIAHGQRSVGIQCGNSRHGAPEIAPNVKAWPTQ